MTALTAPSIRPLHLHTRTCLACDFALSAQSQESLEAQMQDHAAFVNATKDRSTDVHFEDDRLTALVVS